MAYSIYDMDHTTTYHGSVVTVTISLRKEGVLVLTPLISMHMTSHAGFHLLGCVCVGGGATQQCLCVFCMLTTLYLINSYIVHKAGSCVDKAFLMGYHL